MTTSGLQQLRKFSIVAGAMLATTALTVMRVISGAEYVSIIQFCVATYVAGNVASAITSTIRKQPTGTSDQGGQP